MANRIRLTVAVGFSVLVPSFQDAAAAQACASISGVWGDPSGMWQINQDAAGYITGQQTQGGGADTTCPTNEVYSLAGRYLGNGSFTLTGTYTGNKPSLCAASFTQSGTVSGLQSTKPQPPGGVRLSSNLLLAIWIGAEER